MENGHLSEEERHFLDKLAHQLEISAEEYAEILANLMKYPINPPYLHTQRLERLYDLSRMVYADHVLYQDKRDFNTFCFGFRIYARKRSLYY